MADPVAEAGMLFIQAIIGGGIWGIPLALYAKYRKGETISVKRLAITFAVAILAVLIVHYGGLGLPQAFYWLDAMGIAALVGKWLDNLEKKLGTPAPVIPPPPPPPSPAP